MGLGAVRVGGSVGIKVETKVEKTIVALSGSMVTPEMRRFSCEA